YEQKDGPVGDFAFGDEVVRVFDDMLHRSVPFYDEVQRMILELAGDFAADGTNVYDLGCSAGTTLQNLDSLAQQVTLVGIDSSPEMIAKAEETFARSSLRHPYTLLCRDLNDGPRMENASVAVLSLTLQFVRPLYRERILREIRNGLNDDGCLILVEKVLAEESLLNRMYVKYYYDFKRRNGYSDLEIARKREALENVLIPYRLKENEELLRNAGFRAVDVFFKWYNFSGVVALR
ncbi:MAG: tRNA (cmo5U34)-methyltransferase, partial [Candidatus Binatota bacterium]|nr:tRNA (cmo5U34)-methyltransferase [Candidatus Binatota bacterium]